MRRVMSTDRPGAFNQALMDLGSLICIAKGQPLCGECPLRTFCAVSEQEAAEYPKRRPKKPRRIEKKTVLLLQKGDCLLLHKRPEKGLLAGLWLFPMVEGNLSRTEVWTYLEQQGIAPETVQKIDALDPAKHIFSHIEWHMTGYHVTLSAQACTLLPPGTGFSLDGQAEEQKPLADGVYESRLKRTEPEKVEERVVWADPEAIAMRYAIPAAHRPFFVER